MSEVIQSLWIGPSLSAMEQLSIASFLRQGHPYHLYVFDDVADVPAGVTLFDAREILPASSIFRYREHDSVAGFSNFFRYKLLAERGGWWADTDVVCLRPFDFAGEHVFASESFHGQAVVTSCVLRAPAESAAMRQAWERCSALDPASIAWGETGPKLCAEVVRSFGLQSFVEAPEVFCPVPWWEWRSFVDGSWSQSVSPATHAVHLWNEMWRRNGVAKTSLPDGLRAYVQ
jgi:Glycosyltransferase sugar-binding region containing DXD motif/Alpha 1,4-glycosyltransferase conserved region